MVLLMLAVLPLLEEIWAMFRHSRPKCQQCNAVHFVLRSTCCRVEWHQHLLFDNHALRHGLASQWEAMQQVCCRLPQILLSCALLIPLVALYLGFGCCGCKYGGLSYSLLPGLLWWCFSSCPPPLLLPLWMLLVLVCITLAFALSLLLLLSLFEVSTVVLHVAFVQFMAHMPLKRVIKMPSSMLMCSIIRVFLSRLHILLVHYVTLLQLVFVVIVVGCRSHACSRWHCLLVTSMRVIFHSCLFFLPFFFSCRLLTAKRDSSNSKPNSNNNMSLHFPYRMSIWCEKSTTSKARQGNHFKTKYDKVSSKAKQNKTTGPNSIAANNTKWATAATGYWKSATAIQSQQLR